MSNLALWSRPAWNTDRWLRDFFGPAAVSHWRKPAASGFNPAAEIVKDGDDAVVRVELPGRVRRDPALRASTARHQRCAAASIGAYCDEKHDLREETCCPPRLNSPNCTTSSAACGGA